jgi:alpha-beta hydrolase superfamily lysophospholipase
MPPNGPYDKIALHRLVKTGITPKGAVFIYEGWAGGSSGERAISNPPNDNWTKLENFSQPIYWANRGFEVYAMDFRTHFIPDDLNLSQASYIANWGFDQMMSDMKEGVNKAKEVSGFLKIFMVGHGNGATAIVNYAALYGKEDLRGIILLDADLPGPQGPVVAKRGNETNTYNLTLTINSMIAMGTWAITPSSLSATTHARNQYAVDHPGAPAEYPPGTPLSPAINPLTNKTWANITEYMVYTNYYGSYGPGGLSNLYGGYGNITVYLQYMILQDRLIPARYSLESNAWINWVNCPYLKYDFDDHYSEINVPVLAISSQLFSNRTGAFRFINGLATADFTGIMLPNYGLFDLVIGTYSARDVSQPALEWMVNHSPSDWTLVNDGRGVKAYPDLKEYVWQKNPVTAPNGPYDKIGLHRMVKTGITPKAVIFILPGERWANGEEFLSNPPQDNWTVYENYSLPIYLAKRDFDVYALDYRSHFAPTGEGMTAAQLPFMINWGWDQWVSDIKEAVNKAKEVSGAKKIFILGVRTTGGEAAMDFASLYWKDDLRGLILFDGKQPVAAKPSGQTNTYNLKTQIESLDLSKNYATPMWTISNHLFRFRYALNNPGAPAEYPPGTPLKPSTNPLTNKTWTNITEWAAYFLQYINPYLSNIDGGYGNVTRDLQLYSKADQWWPTRLGVESLAISDWTNCPYVTRDFDELYNEINVPLLAFSGGFSSNQSGTYQFVNGIKNSDFTGKVLANYGSTDMLVGDYAARDVFAPTYDWMINHLPSPLMASASQSSTAVTTGNIASLYAYPSGGISPYTYQWYQGTSQVGTNNNILAFYPATAGAYTYYCKITDAEGTATNTNVMTLTVNAPATPAPATETPMPTPNPTSTPTQTPTLTHTPTPTPTSSPSPIPSESTLPAQTPANPQFALTAEATYAIAAIVIIIIVAVVALVLRKRAK